MKKVNWTIFLSITAIVISISTICLQLFVFAKQIPSPDDMYKGMIKQHLQHFSAPLPDSLSFCGEQVPLDNVFVREALDRELTSIMYQHNSTFLILKRSWRFMPEIEQLLAEFGGQGIEYVIV